MSRTWPGTREAMPPTRLALLLHGESHRIMARRPLLVVETVTSLAWLAMDACWMFDARAPALVLAAVTLGASLLAFRFVPRTWTSGLVTAAMTSWVGMNILWMAHDFGILGWGLVASKVLFAVGALMLGAALLIGRQRAIEALTMRFRRAHSHAKWRDVHRPTNRVRRGLGRRRAHHRRPESSVHELTGAS